MSLCYVSTLFENIVTSSAYMYVYIYVYIYADDSNMTISMVVQFIPVIH